MAAALPPRKTSTPTKFIRHSTTPLQILLQMGVPKHRAEKALAATGHRGVQLASDWLLAHVNDPTLDDTSPREYVLYICPVGTLQDQLQTFWTQSLCKIGRNGAHACMPHITLIPFFKVTDSLSVGVSRKLDDVFESFKLSLPETFSLEPYISHNFMGYFISERDGDPLKKVAAAFVNELHKERISAEFSNQALHLTLAYHFTAAQYPALEKLVKEIIEPNAAANWQLRLYSRDLRQAGKDVYRVIYPHVPRETDELELLLGDFVYVKPEAWKNSVDGWVEGISWLTGCSGFLPQNYVERTAESDAWTLHKVIRLHQSDLVDDIEEPLSLTKFLLNGRTLSEQTLQTSEIPSVLDVNKESSPAVESVWNPITEESAKLKEKPENGLPTTPKFAVRPESPQWPLSQPIPGPRNLFIVRHGERVDFTFGAWIPYCFDESGNYLRKDLNMPLSVPKRQGSPDTFFKDSPLTCIGETEAYLLGEAMRLSGVPVHHVFCSPALRCLQTCKNILKGLQIDDQMPICVEPGLFEWLVWYQDKLPQFMTADEIVAAGFRIDPHYRPFVSFTEIEDREESSEQYYMRSFYLTQCVLRSTSQVGGNVLLVGHASTLDACSRQLTGGTARSANDLSRLVYKVPYCSMAAVQQVTGEDDIQQNNVDEPLRPDGKWKLVEPPVPPITYTRNARFDWQVLL